jgi:hypothetical protein
MSTVARPRTGWSEIRSLRSIRCISVRCLRFLLNSWPMTIAPVIAGVLRLAFDTWSGASGLR